MHTFTEYTTTQMDAEVGSVKKQDVLSQRRDNGNDKKGLKEWMKGKG